MSGTVLITGAGGFIGKRLADFLSEKYEVVSWSRDIIDLEAGEDVRREMEETQPDLIFHLAAVGLRNELTSTELVYKNLLMAHNVVQSAPRGSRIVVAGTMSEYGTGGVLAESAFCSPDTPYAFSKLAVTHYVLGQAKTLSLSATVARLFGVYGEGEDTVRLIPSLFNALKTAAALDLSDGEQVRDFVHVDDVCRSLELIALSADDLDGKVLNVGTGEGLRVREVVEWVFRTCGGNISQLRFGQIARNSNDKDVLIADTTTHRDLLGWNPEPRLCREEGESMIKAWFTASQES